MSSSSTKKSAAGSPASNSRNRRTPQAARKTAAAPRLPQRRAGTTSAKPRPASSANALLGPLPASTPADRILLEIRRFIASSIFFNSQAAGKAGLILTDMQLLHMLQLHGPSTPGRLAAFTRLSSGGVTVALDRLEKSGYILREPNPADRRSLLVHIIPTRLARLAGMYEEVEAATRRQLATLSLRDLDAVLRFFQALGSIRASD
jgi:DNA-binding MarR family transcriptional regulator